MACFPTYLYNYLWIRPNEDSMSLTTFFLASIYLLICSNTFAGSYRVTNGKSFQVLPSIVSSGIRNIDFNQPNNIDLESIVLKLLPKLNQKSLIAFEVVTFPNPFDELGQVLYTSPSNIEAASLPYIHIDTLSAKVQETIQPSYWESNCVSTLESLKQHGHFASLLKVVAKSTNNGDCHKNVQGYLDQNSVWKDLNRRERAIQYYNTAKDIVQKMKIKGVTNYCLDEYLEEFVKLKKLQNTNIAQPYSINKNIIKYVKSSLSVDNKYELTSFISEGTRARLRNGDFSKFYIHQDEISSFVDMYYEYVIESFSKYYNSKLNLVSLKTEDVLTKEKLLALVQAGINSTDNFIDLDNIKFSSIIHDFLQDKLKTKYHEVVIKKYPELQKYEEIFSDHITSAIEHVSNGEINRKNMNNLCFQTMRYLKENNKVDFPNEIFQKMELKREMGLKSYRNLRDEKNVIHQDLNAEMALCIGVTESSVTHFDPLTLNYGFCSNAGRKRVREGKLPASSAIGILQMVKSTFSEGIKRGIWSPEVVSMEHLTRDVKENPNLLFEYMINDPEMQIEVQLRYLNYLLKRPILVEKMQNVVKDLKEGGEGDINNMYKAVIAYDQDRASCYYRKFKQCYECMEKGNQVNYCSNLRMEHEDCE